ncbi:zinc finger protein 497-like [Ischnura elegans]|uniref:zinc finger protein 497-like n=1 Tax=Ischnura elegans TaxID=197161 RepID=UPI001ED891D9|nr:zinc finger protein 497-like [Ischnura elegans]
MATKNIEDLCRICVQESQSYKHIYSKCIEDAYLYEVINALCHIDISTGDGLPEYICSECYDKVLGFHKFQKTCHDGKAALLSIKMKYSEEMAIDPSNIKTEVFMDEIEYDGYGCEEGKGDIGDSPVGSEGADDGGDMEPRGSDAENAQAVNQSGVPRIVPVGLVKFPRHGSGASASAVAEGLSRIPLLPSDAMGDGGVTLEEPRGDDCLRDPQEESVLPNGVEEYQAGGVIPAFTSVDVPRPFDGSEGDGYVIKQIYGSEGAEGEERPEDSFPFMGRAGERNKAGYECPHCGKRISRRFDFESHLRIHSGIKPFECHVCHATFNLKKRLKAHMNVHLAMKLFICAYCMRKFKSKDALRLHIYVHAGERLPDRPSKPSEVWCAVCGVSVLESCLAHHMRTHSRGLDCSVCGEACRDEEELQSHQRVHDHVKRFQCKKCGKRYGLKGNLAQHMMTHTCDKRFACATCGRKFYTGSRLRRHEKVHSSERNVLCSVCGRAFKTKYYLKQHLKTHEGGHRDAPYQCLTCLQRYKWPGDLRKHCRVKGHDPGSCEKMVSSA